MFDKIETYKLNLDLSNTCRLCLAKNIVMTDIYSYDTEISLLDKIQSLASVTISRSDNLPALICDECRRCIEYFVEFRNKIEFSYQYICNFVNQHSGEEENSKSSLSSKPLQTLPTKEIQHDECIAVNFEKQIYDSHLHEKCKSENKLTSKKDIEFDQHGSTLHSNIEGSSDKRIVSSTDRLPLDFYTDNYLIGPQEIPKNYETSPDQVPESFIINEAEVLSNIFNCNDNLNETNGLDYLNKLLKDDNVDEMGNLKDVTVKQLSAKNTQIMDTVTDDVSTEIVNNIEEQETITSENTEPSNKTPVMIQHELRQSQANLIRRMAFLEQSIQIDEQEEIMPRITEVEIDHSNLETSSSDSNVSIYFCHICLEEFSSYDIAVFFDHSVSHFGDVALNQTSPPFDCELCSKLFPSRYNLVLHQRMHCNIEPFQCVDCKQKFLNLDLFNDHQKEIIPCGNLSKALTCHICGRIFKRKCDLMYHAQSHVLKKKSLQCDVCNTFVSNKKVLDIHRRRHFSAKKYSCDKCDKCFHLRSELLRHDQLHTGKRKFPCPTCDKAFMSKSELNRHSVYHSKQRNFKCDLCDKSFYESCHLNDHKKTHNKINSFVCEICGDSFPSACKFKKHSKTHTRRKIKEKSLNDDVTDNGFQVVTLPAGVTALEGLSMELVESCGDDSLIIIAEGTEEAINEMTYLIVND